jgi:hypothetical protein
MEPSFNKIWDYYVDRNTYDVGLINVAHTCGHLGLGLRGRQDTNPILGWAISALSE